MVPVGLAIKGANMAGLLDAFGDENTRFSLGLLAAAGPRFDGANDGQRIQEALQGMDAYKQRQTQAQMQKMQMEQMQNQIAKQKQMEELAKRYATPATPAMQGPQVPLNMQGDTGPNLYSPSASNMSTSGMQPAKPAGFDYQGYAQSMTAVDPMESLRLQQILQKDESPLTLKEGESLIDRKTLKPIFSLPKAEASPSAVKEYQFAVGQGYKGSFQQFQLEQKRAGATNVSVPVNLGQRGLDNTLKVRGDFRSEPIYKAHSEVQSAHSQISQSLKMNSPAGDLAGATKLMKILDPGSVVRESELGMAMAASGLMDRATNYADMVIKGTKLTPTQRKDFQALADALMNESTKQYAGKRNEYKGIAERNGLSVEDILGTEPAVKPPASNSKKVVKTGIYQGRKVVQYDDGTTGYAD